MPALLILNYDVTDPDALDAYRTMAAPILIGPGCGELLATTTDTVDLGEGTATGTHTVILRFPTIAAAQEIYESAAYQAVIGDRFAATTPRFALIVQTRD